MKRIRKYVWLLLIPAMLLGLFAIFTITKEVSARSNRRIAECVADFQEFEPSSPTLVMRLFRTLYFPTYQLKSEDVVGEELIESFSVTKEGAYWAVFEENGRWKELCDRLVIYKSDLQGKNLTSIYSVEGEFYHAAAIGIRDALVFSYWEEKDNAETQQILLYDLGTHEVSTIATGQQMSLVEAAAAEQEKKEQEEDLYTINASDSGFIIRSREDGTTVATLPQEFWKDTQYASAFEDNPVWRTTTTTWHGTVILTVWMAFPSGFFERYVAASFAYDPVKDELAFLSCIQPYEFASFDIFLLE